MIAEIRHKTDPAIAPLVYVLCEVCKAEGPRVPYSDPGRFPESEAEEAAARGGWTIHMECVRTPVRKQSTGCWSTQYFCPEHADQAGKVPVIKQSRKRKEHTK